LVAWLCGKIYSLHKQFLLGKRSTSNEIKISSSIGLNLLDFIEIQVGTPMCLFAINIIESQL